MNMDHSYLLISRGHNSIIPKHKRSTVLLFYWHLFKNHSLPAPRAAVIYIHLIKKKKNQCRVLFLSLLPLVMFLVITVPYDSYMRLMSALWLMLKHASLKYKKWPWISPKKLCVCLVGLLDDGRLMHFRFKGKFTAMDFVQSALQWISVTKQVASYSSGELYSVTHSIYPWKHT